MVLSPFDHAIPVTSIPTANIVELLLQQYDLSIDLRMFRLDNIIPQYFHDFFLSFLNVDDLHIQVELFFWNFVNPTFVRRSKTIQVYIFAHLVFGKLSWFLVLFEPETHYLVVF